MNMGVGRKRCGEHGEDMQQNRGGGDSQEVKLVVEVAPSKIGAKVTWVGAKVVQRLAARTLERITLNLISNAWLWPSG